MKKYRVTLQKEEREELEALTRKGLHQSQRVLSALILLNCDEGEFNDHRVRGADVAKRPYERTDSPVSTLYSVNQLGPPAPSTTSLRALPSSDWK